MDIQNFWVFALTGLILNLTPGNDMIYVTTRSTSQGVKAGIVSALGITAGCFVHIVGAVAGLSAIISQSSAAFDIIKYIGAGYLIYLGFRCLCNKKKGLAITRISQVLTHKKIFLEGVLTNVLNPKVALFFLAFLPQFININNSDTHWQILLLGAWFNTSGAIVNILVSVLFGKLGNWFSHSARLLQWQQKITGIVLIGLGIRVALTKPS